MNKKNILTNIAVFAVVAAVFAVASKDFLRMHQRDLINTSNSAITEVKMLSDYSPGLKGTNGDTEIYVLKGEKEGGTALILGGTHPNEIASMLSALTYVENVKIDAGTLYIMPVTNSSGYTHTAPLRGQMDMAEFVLEDGSTREFRMGTRLSNPIDQWPDPNWFLGASGRELRNTETAEVRNLNRNHPGDVNGTFTEKINYGISNLINTEKIDVLYDGHEAGPEFLRVNYTIAHERAMPLASMATMNANIDGFPFKVDVSGASSYGLSHRALGDNTNVYATLFETLNPCMGTSHGKVTEELVLGGKGANYVAMTNAGKLNSGELTEAGSPIELRTAYHMVITKNILESLKEIDPTKAIEFSGLPSFETMSQYGLGATLKPIQ